MNKFILKDSFDAVNKIKNIPPYLFDGGYNYVYIFWCGIFIHKCSHQKSNRYHSQSNLYGRSYFYQLKEAFNEKLLLETCAKAAFTMFKGVICEQKDSLSMGSNLGPLLPNVIYNGRLWRKGYQTSDWWQYNQVFHKICRWHLIICN